MNGCQEPQADALEIVDTPWNSVTSVGRPKGGLSFANHLPPAPLRKSIGGGGLTTELGLATLTKPVRTRIIAPLRIRNPRTREYARADHTLPR